MNKTLLAAAFALTIGACHKESQPTGVICTALAAAGLGVYITDANTGVASGFTGVSIVARAGTYKDSVQVGTIAAPDTIPLAYEHRGTVQVVVRAEGYAPWVNNSVTITGDVCHVHQEFVNARLVR